MSSTPLTSSQISSGWEKLGSSYYEKQTFTKMFWPEEINLATQLASVAPYGGPIAFVRNPRVIQPILKAGSSSHDQFSIYNGSGSPITRFPRDSSKVLALGWSSDEKLVVATDHGYILIYNVFDPLLTERFPITIQGVVPKQSKTTQALRTMTTNPVKIEPPNSSMPLIVSKAQVTHNEVVCYTNSGRFFMIESFNSKQQTSPAFWLPDVSAHLDKNPPSSFCIIPAHLTDDKTSQVLISPASETNLIVVNRVSVSEINFVAGGPTGPFSCIRVSNHGSLILLLNTSNHLWVVDRTYKTIGTVVLDSTPDSIEFSGSDTVIMAFRQEIKLFHVTQPNTMVEFDCDDFQQYRGLILVPEYDGCRIITGHNHDFVSIVPQPIQNIFDIGSITPAAKLFEASDLFYAKNAASDANIRSIGTNMPNAIAECISAAGKMFNTNIQKRLLTAASFGSLFLDYHDSKPLQIMTSTLRVLNTLRSPSIGQYVTHVQYLHMSPRVVVERLASRHFHQEAYQICQHLNINPSYVLTHWACRKVRFSPAKTPDELKILLHTILAKTEKCHEVNYCAIARAAFKSGKTTLAIPITLYDPRPEYQIRVLLQMNQHQLALETATKAFDPNFLYNYFFQVSRTAQGMKSLFSNLSQLNSLTATKFFLDFLSARFPFFNLSSAYRQHFVEFVKDHVLRTGFLADWNLEQVAQVERDVALGVKILPEQTKTVVKILDSQKTNYTSDANVQTTYPLFVRMQSQLYLLQQKMETDLKIDGIVGKTVHETLGIAYSYNKSKYAKQLIKEQDISNSAAFRVQLQDLISRNQWTPAINLVEKQGRKGPPIGFPAVVDMVLFNTTAPPNDIKVNATRFIKSISDELLRVKYFLEIGDKKSAEEVYQLCKNSETREKISYHLA